MVRAKICGITNPEDAAVAVAAGYDALGFVFYRKSPRYITPAKAKRIIAGLPKSVAKVGVFVNAREKTVKNIARECRLGMLQFHGDETPEYCRRFKGYKIIKAFRIKDKNDLEKLRGYKVFAYLFDTFSRQRFGGTGKAFDWKLVKDIVLERPVFLSGGLNKRNVAGAIRAVGPHWVDVSSSVESGPGKKDRREVNRFIKMVKG